MKKRLIRIITSNKEKVRVVDEYIKKMQSISS